MTTSHGWMWRSWEIKWCPVYFPSMFKVQDAPLGTEIGCLGTGVHHVGFPLSFEQMLLGLSHPCWGLSLLWVSGLKNCVLSRWLCRGVTSRIVSLACSEHMLSLPHSLSHFDFRALSLASLIYYWLQKIWISALPLASCMFRKAPPHSGLQPHTRRRWSFWKSQTATPPTPTLHPSVQRPGSQNT